MAALLKGGDNCRSCASHLDAEPVKRVKHVRSRAGGRGCRPLVTSSGLAPLALLPALRRRSCGGGAVGECSDRTRSLPAAPPRRAPLAAAREPALPSSPAEARVTEAGECVPPAPCQPSGRCERGASGRAAIHQRSGGSPAAQRRPEADRQVTHQAAGRVAGRWPGSLAQPGPAGRGRGSRPSQPGAQGRRSWSQEDGAVQRRAQRQPCALRRPRGAAQRAAAAPPAAARRAAPVERSPILPVLPAPLAGPPQSPRWGTSRSSSRRPTSAGTRCACGGGQASAAAVLAASDS